MLRIVKLPMIALVVVGTATAAFSGGFMIPQLTARAVGQSNALTASVDDASAVHYNAAAVGEIEGNNLLVSGTYVNIVSSVENSGRKGNNQRRDHYLPSLFGNYHVPGSDFSLGIGTYAPFGLGTSYERDFTRFAAERTELKTLYVTPALSWHPSKYFALGGGVSFVHASGTFTRGLCLDPFAGCVAQGGPLEGRLRLTDTTNTYAYNLGLLVKPTDNIKFGLTYRSRADLRFSHADVKLGGSFSPTSVHAKVRPVTLPVALKALKGSNLYL